VLHTRLRQASKPVTADWESRARPKLLKQHEKLMVHYLGSARDIAFRDYLGYCQGVEVLVTPLRKLIRRG